MNTNNTKRKKRKTRRCLDEIRKRSRSGFNNSKIIYDHEKKESSAGLRICGKLPIKNTSITNERLTLAMFPKAITSETITRPTLRNVTTENIDFIQHKNNNTLNEGNISSDQETSKFSVQTRVTNRNSSIETLFLKHKEINKTCLGNSNSADHVRSVSHSRREFDLFQRTSSSSTTSGVSNGNSITCMKEVPYLLPLRTQMVFHPDPVKRIKDNLLRILVEGCQEEEHISVKRFIESPPHRFNLTRQISHSFGSGDKLMENPVDYLKLGQVWNSNLGHENHPTDTSPPGSPAAHSPLLNIIQDTPDYHYFPHKLNQ